MDDEKKLYFLREEIDTIDSEIITLLESRLKLTNEVGKIKEQINKTFQDIKREEDINRESPRKAKRYKIRRFFLSI